MGGQSESVIFMKSMSRGSFGKSFCLHLRRLDQLGGAAASNGSGALEGAADFEAQAARLSASLDDDDDQGADAGDDDEKADDRATPPEVCSLSYAYEVVMADVSCERRVATPSSVYS